MLASRRALLAAGAASLAFPALAWGQARADKKLVFLLLRGGLDGLTALPPTGDPDYRRLRGSIAVQNALPLDQSFGLHPHLIKMKAMYDARELLPIHACATAYRERSHFDGQNVLETGAARPFGRDEGWLNAALAALAPSGDRELGIALADQAPLVLRGPGKVATWAPSTMSEPSNDTVARLIDLYQHRDAALASALQSAVSVDHMAGGQSAMAGGGGAYGQTPALARVAANFLKQPQGPIAAVIEMTGWDTHANEGADEGQLARNLTILDDTMDTLKAEMGPAWSDTVVVVATEFGRTAAVNGNYGTDHGTGAAAFVAGGGVAGGRVLTDWPGLSQAALLDQRDLRPTTDLRSVLKGVLSDHLRVADAALDRDVFPDSADARRSQGLLRA